MGNSLYQAWVRQKEKAAAELSLTEIDVMMRSQYSSSGAVLPGDGLQYLPQYLPQTIEPQKKPDHPPHLHCFEFRVDMPFIQHANGAVLAEGKCRVCGELAQFPVITLTPDDPVTIAGGPFNRNELLALLDYLSEGGKLSEEVVEKIDLLEARLESYRDAAFEAQATMKLIQKLVVATIRGWVNTDPNAEATI